MAARPGRFPGLRLALIACCPATPSPEDSSWGAGPTQLPAAVASLHVRSEQDTLVPAADSEAIQAAAFVPGLAEVYMHAKGHAMPCAQRDVDTYVAFLARLRRPASAPTPAPAPAAAPSRPY